MRFKIFGAALIALGALSVSAAPAGAVVANTAAGRVGYLPLNPGATGQAATPKGFTVPSGEPPLVWHGGPVMHSQEAYAIFWAPSGFSFPTGYKEAIEGFLKNVAADSGQSSNVYSVSAQYTDGTGHASYIDSFGGAVTDTTAYPTSGTCPTYSGAESFTACITDAKLETEVDSVVAAQGWPTGLGAEYYVVLPPHAGSCFEVAGKQCFDKQFCAYHSFAESSETIYANISYSPGDVFGCGVGEYPNGHANGNVDDTLSSLSHEANESITDPELNAWFDEAEPFGFENGDECRNTPFEEDFGEPLGGPSGALFNQAINGAHYYLQQEWSNDIEDCTQRFDPAKPVIADPEEVKPGESVLFDASGSLKGGGKIVSYTWEFEDGGTTSGPSPTTFHTYAGTGTFGVTLTIEDDGGFSYSTEREVTVVENPQRTLTVSLAGSGSGTVTGTGIFCPGTCSHSYPKGEAVTLTATPASGSTFTGWSGGGCSGTGTCKVTLITKQAVTATFTVPTPTGGGGESPPPASGSTPAPSPITPKKAVKCRKGFRKTTKHGKAVCVKVKKHRKHR
jgi:hypothetical protein